MSYNYSIRQCSPYYGYGMPGPRPQVPYVMPMYPYTRKNNVPINKPAIDRITPEQADPELAGLCPWLSCQEWEQVYDWLYSKESHHVEQGIARVAAWKARAPNKLPLVIEITADLAECHLNERKASSCVARGISLSYSMAITRFINGVFDIASNHGLFKGNIKGTVEKYGIPSWLVEVRHQGTHSLLPPIGLLHAATQFGLNWLRANYWRPQRKLIHSKMSKNQTEPAKSLEPLVTTQIRPVAESAVSRLTLGLCSNRLELANLLATADYREMAQCMLNKQLLCFPQKIKITVNNPDVSDVLSFPTIKGDFSMWMKHLSKSANEDPSLKLKLSSALVKACHDSCDVYLRDYFSAWLGLVLVDHYEVERNKPSHVEVLTIVDDNDQFFPGSLDWLQLLTVCLENPGYYTHAIMTQIDAHLPSILSESARKRILDLSKLVTLSERVNSPQHISLVEGSHMSELNEVLKNFTSRNALVIEGTSQKHPPVHAKWSVVSDMKQWVGIPLGMCPGQDLTASCLDLPSCVNSQPQKVKKIRRSADSLNQELNQGAPTWDHSEPVKKIKLDITPITIF